MGSILGSRAAVFPTSDDGRSDVRRSSAVAHGLRSIRPLAAPSGDLDILLGTSQAVEWRQTYVNGEKPAEPRNTEVGTFRLTLDDLGDGLGGASPNYMTR